MSTCNTLSSIKQTFCKPKYSKYILSLIIMSGYWLCGWDLDHTINNIIVKPCLAELLRIGQDITGLINVKVLGGMYTR